MERYIKTDILAKIVFDKWQECDELKHIIPAIRNAVMCASTDDVRENVHAHWVYKAMEGFPEITFPVCSNCDEDAIEYVESNFCPYCGAQMDKGSEDEH